MNATDTIVYLDAPRLERAMLAGMDSVSARPERCNRINGFPGRGGDKGTGPAFASIAFPDPKPEVFDTCTAASGQGLAVPCAVDWFGVAPCSRVVGFMRWKRPEAET